MKTKYPYSLLTVLGLILLMLTVRLLVPRWDTLNVKAVLTWDVLGYYLYLPSYFIYDDIFKFEFMPEILDIYHPTNVFYQAYPAGNGNLVIKYPIGVSILYAPFFFLGHIYAKIAGYPADGFSAPYQFAIGLSAVFYSAIALLVLRGVLLRYFSDKIVALTFAIGLLGLNYMQYVFIDGAMTHGYLFFMYAWLLYFTIKWHETPRKRYAITLGLIIGLSTIIRPTDIICCLIPLLWGVTSRADIHAKAQLVWKYRLHFILLIITAFIATTPILIYWKTVTGNWLFYSYDDQGFSWFDPYFRVLFGFEKGWFVYTPLAYLFVFGFYYLYQHYRTIFWATFVYFILNTYIVISWDVWWYGGSYSCRALVQSYAVLFLSLAAFLTHFFKEKQWKKWVFGIVLIPLIALNLFQIWQYNENIIQSEGIKKAYYKRIFGKTSVSRYDLSFLDNKDYIKDESKYEKRLLGKHDFESDTLNVVNKEFYQGNKAYHCRASVNEFSKGFEFKYKDFLAYDEAWLKVSLWAKHGDWETYARLVTVIEKDGKPEKWRGVHINNHLNTPGQWAPVYYYYKIPKGKDPESVIKSYIYTQRGEKLFVDEYRIELLTR